MVASNNLKKVNITALKIAFLMPHQNVLPDLKELATELCPAVEDVDKINRDSPEYLLGAFEALAALIYDLEHKGPQHK